MARPLQQVLAYRKDLVDAVTCGPVTSSTTLVNLHKPDESTGDGKLVACLTGVARPAKGCFLVLEDGETLGLSFARGEAPYCLHFTFNRLLTAPAARLEVQIPTGVPGELPLKVSLEFAFTDEARQSDHVSLEKFSFQPRVERLGRRKDEIVFDSFGASCEGLVNAEKRASSFGEPVIRILAVLRGLITSKTRTTLRFRFFDPVESYDSALPLVLPYITGPVKLPSLSLPAWSTLMPPKPERSISELLKAAAPHPMVQFAAGVTFSSPTAACVEYYESARIQHLEEDTALGQWKAVDHFGTLYQVGGAVVMALRFGDFKQLGGPGAGHFSLPDKLTVKMRWENKAGDQFHCDAARSTLPIQLPSVHDAIFIIKKANDKMLNACIKPSDDLQGEILNIHVTSSENKFTLESKLSTAINLMHPDASKWHPLLLNHDNSALETVDLALKRVQDVEVTPEIEQAVEEAFQKLLTFTNWNNEQLDALRSLRKSVGGMVLITGPAGVGKTLVLQALCAFFYKIGLHVLFVAPANSNVADFCKKLAKLFPEIDATRVFPSSKDFNPDKIAKNVRRGADPKDSTNGPLGDAQIDILEFDMARAEVDSRDKYGTFEEVGLAAKVLKLAREGGMSNVEVVSGVSECSWEILRTCIQKATEGTFDWRNEKDVQKYQQAYDKCKAHHMALCRLVATTTGNFRCADIINNWAMEKHGVVTNGIVVVLDEACKDSEIDSISPLLLPDYRHKIIGMVMLGDERQLEPTNTSAKGRQCFNNFTDRLNMPFLSRLKAEGFPCTELVVQHRMSKHIAEVPSRFFYAGSMLNGPGTEHTLAHKKPGLYSCAKSIIARLDPNFNTVADLINEDKALRTHYFSVAGIRDSSKRSPFVNEHIRFFFSEIFWTLHAYYGESMNENVMVICAYKGTKNLYQEAMSHLQKKHQLPACQLPQLLTIDSSQGCEAPVTIIDCAVQQYDPRLKYKHVGFVDDDKRMNVAFTRSQDIRWVIGGGCSIALRKSRSKEVDTPAYVRYRDEVEGTAEVTKLPMQKLPQGEDWIKKLEKRTVCCGLKFRDEVTETEE
ncbi:unnamed protein product [Zymoseptoria tritici ST99CH_3D1]|nr:unnamed protein product [Zymoseptoria tritici ST99CH_3D1]